MSEDNQSAETLSTLMRQDPSLEYELFDLAEQRDIEGLHGVVSKAIGKRVEDPIAVFNKAYELFTDYQAIEFGATGE